MPSFPLFLLRSCESVLCLPVFGGMGYSVICCLTFSSVITYFHSLLQGKFTLLGIFSLSLCLSVSVSHTHPYNQSHLQTFTYKDTGTLLHSYKRRTHLTQRNQMKQTQILTKD